MSISKIQPGMSFSRNFKVREEWAADRMGSGHVPVLSTAALVLAMENTAASSILPYLDEGSTSVGSRVDLVHLYPTPVGEFFTIDLVVARVEKNRLDFTMTARDEHRVISTGFHRRHVVDTATFLERVLPGPGGRDDDGLPASPTAREIPIIDEDGTGSDLSPRGSKEGTPRHPGALDSDDFNDNDTIF